MTPEEIQARLLYRDGLMLILDKPPGIPVHQGPSKKESLEDYFEHLRFGLPRDPALAHRLDADTSGCLVLGRHAKALRKLGKLFQQGKIKKTYWAVAEGVPAEKEGRIALKLKKVSTVIPAQAGIPIPETVVMDPRLRGGDGKPRGARGLWRMVAGEEGQEAVTDYKVLAEKDGRAFIELYPQTGRTHQIRAHLSAIGCPIVGDFIYGTKGPRLYLHSRAIEVPLYPSRAPILTIAPPPPHMMELAEWGAGSP